MPLARPTCSATRQPTVTTRRSRARCASRAARSWRSPSPRRWPRRDPFSSKPRERERERENKKIGKFKKVGAGARGVEDLGVAQTHPPTSRSYDLLVPPSRIDLLGFSTVAARRSLGQREVVGGVEEGDVREGLREVADEPAGDWVVLLGQ